MSGKMDTIDPRYRTIGMPTIALLIGLIAFGFGIYERVTSPTKGLEAATGYYYGSMPYEYEDDDFVSSEMHIPAYILVYRFTVDSEEYFAVSDEPSPSIPNEDSTIEIIYNPNNPNEAVIGTLDQTSSHYIFIGLGFSMFSVLLFVIHANELRKIIRAYKIENYSDYSAPKVDFISIVIGVVSVFVGYGGSGFLKTSFSITGIINGYKTHFTSLMILPLLFIAGGVFAIIKSIFSIKINKTR